jgi:hypothetical protein
MAAEILHNHRVGGSSGYDADMEFVELIVKCIEEPDNSLIQLALYNSYMGKILQYWDTYLQASKNGNISELKVTFYAYSKSAFNNQNLEEQKEFFSILLQGLETNFTATQKVNTVEIQAVFLFIGDMMCGYSLDKHIKDLKFPDKNFSNWVLPNEIGLFGLNTYMLCRQSL